MAKTNFQYEKRQKELEKKKKTEEKAKRKLENKNKPADGAPDEEGGIDGAVPDGDPAPAAE
jgi:hypothetical protein